MIGQAFACLNLRLRDLERMLDMGIRSGYFDGWSLLAGSGQGGLTTANGQKRAFAKLKLSSAETLK